MGKKFFVTTPIYYSNDIPHIGHAYSTLIADTYARFKRLLGYEVKFSTWVDENSQKIVQKAAAAGVDLYDYLDDYAHKHLAVWDALDISYTDFVRTTGRSVTSEKRGVDFQYDHHKLVQKILQEVYDRWDIHKGTYEWHYCVGCEAFKKHSDLIPAMGEYEGIAEWTLVCPDHPNALLDIIKEENWFFGLKKYQWFLDKIYADNDSFIIPARRFAEVKSFVQSWLEDFSISREGKTFGIPLPFDSSSVSYVWFDALLNYVTVCQDDDFWSEDTEKIHILGKDISRFHAIYWPAMLESAGLPQPHTEIVTGFFTIDGQKMSKSIGNVINPVEIVEKYGRDALVFYLLYDIPIGTDGDFSTERFHHVYDAILCNAWWNLVNRVVTLCKKNEIVSWKIYDTEDFYLRKFARWSSIEQVPEISKLFSLIEAQKFTAKYSDISFDDNNWTKDILENVYLNKWLLQKYIQDWYKIVQKANEYMQTEQPWTKLKDISTKEEWIKDLQFLLWVVKQLTVLSAPILVEGFAKMQGILGNEELQKIDSVSGTKWQGVFAEVLAMEEFAVDLQPEILYQRIE